MSLAEELSEARSFALYFSGSSASSSTPHLYISALATWPRNLDPCRRWKSHFPRIPGFINASLGGTLLMTLNPLSSVTAIAVSPSGERIVSGSKDKLVRVWDASTGDELEVLKGHEDWVESVAFSPDGKQIVSGSKDKSVRLWNALTGDELNVLNHKHPVTSVAFSPDGEQIVSGSDDTSVRVWDALMGDKSKELKGRTNPTTSVPDDGEQIVSGSYDEWVWDGLTDDVSITSVAFSPDGKQIASGSDDNLVRVWNVETGNKLFCHIGRIFARWQTDSLRFERQISTSLGCVDTRCVECVEGPYRFSHIGCIFTRWQTYCLWLERRIRAGLVCADRR